jgi:hypothetical protein
MAAVDFEVRDADGHPTALIEAKARRGTNSIWAAGLRRNFASHGALRRDVMFVVVTPEAFFIWEPDAELDEFPTYEVVTEAILRPYLARAGLAAGDFVDPEVFEMIVRAWLSDLVAGRVEDVDPHLQNFASRVRGGTVSAEAAA